MVVAKPNPTAMSTAPTRHAFLLGSQRSGTTILSRCLDLHPDIAHFYEPYYLWDRLNEGCPDDVPDPERFTPAFERDIRGNYARFARMSRTPVVLDKSPQHCYTVPYVHRVFPEGRWIHLIRDGRAVTLSTYKEWQERQTLARRRDLRLLLSRLRRSFSLQPFWYFRLKQLGYWVPRMGVGGGGLHINRAKWGGHIGWGLRFPGWQETLESTTLLEFNARQWVEALRHARAGLTAVPSHQVLTVRYEAFVDDPPATLRTICRFLDVDCSRSFLASIPTISDGPTSKWKTELTRAEQIKIEAVLGETLTELGYSSDSGAARG